ncbi:Acetolactate synthase, mitochondrial [Balamuthia mandrillaris]
MRSLFQTRQTRVALPSVVPRKHSHLASLLPAKASSDRECTFARTLCTSAPSTHFVGEELGGFPGRDQLLCASALEVSALPEEAKEVEVGVDLRRPFGSAMDTRNGGCIPAPTPLPIGDLLPGLMQEDPLENLLEEEKRRKKQEEERLAKLRSPHLDPALFLGMNGGNIILDMMLRHDVRQIFGYPGGAILPVFDALHNRSHQFNFVLPRHEQGAGHMAQGYARATGKPGVIVVTSGPGATNLVTALQDALCDGTPLVAFTGQVATGVLGTDGFQEADIVSITKPCTKWNVMVKKLEDLPTAIEEAFKVATSGRPGPVLVDLPKDVTSSTLTQLASRELPQQLRYNTTGREFVRSDKWEKEVNKAIERTAKLINSAKRPVIYAGQGVLSAQAADLLRELATKANIPVTTTLQALGAFDELHPLSLHMLGMHGAAYANLSIQNADLVIALGARFDDRVTGNVAKFAPEARRAEREGRGGIIHFDVCPRNINKVIKTTEAVPGDCGANLQKLLPLVTHKEESDRRAWFEQIKRWKEKYPFGYERAQQGGKMKPQTVIEELDRQCRDIKDKLIVTTGVGQHQMFAAQWFRWRYPRSLITSGGLGTMGFGLPSAMGAKLAMPDKIVVDIDGDGSLSMTAMELATAAEFNIGVKVLLLNNNFQGMVKQWQDLFYEKRYCATKMTNPDFAKFAEALNCKGLRARTEEELPAAIKEFLACDGPVLLDAVVDKNEHVYPMVAAGKALDEMVLFQEQQPNGLSTYLQGSLAPS